jgi:hypothetical protein
MNDTYCDKEGLIINKDCTRPPNPPAGNNKDRGKVKSGATCLEVKGNIQCRSARGKDGSVYQDKTTSQGAFRGRESRHNRHSSSSCCNLVCPAPTGHKSHNHFIYVAQRDSAPAASEASSCPSTLLAARNDTNNAGDSQCAHGDHVRNVLLRVEISRRERGT